MKLSIVIPTYNRVDVLSRALESVFAQTYIIGRSDIEVIVIDDGSLDGTDKLFENNHLAVRYYFQENKGVSSARNLGLTKARGEWIALLDSDDEWLPDKLSRQLDTLDKSGLKVCHTEEIWIRNGVRVNQMNKHQKTGGDIFQKCLPMCAMSPSSIIIHRDIFEHVGCFDESLPACEDYDLWLRICAHYHVSYVAEPCINKYGGHDDQLSRAFWGMDRFRVLALEKLLLETQADKSLSADQVDLVMAVLKKKNRILLNGARKHGNQKLQVACESRIENFDL